MSPRLPRTTARLLLEQVLVQLGPDADLLHAQEREWASATFEGARHSFTFSVPSTGSAGDHIIRQALILADHEFALRAEIVADCHASFGQMLPTGLSGIRQRELVVELLTVNAN